MHNICIVESPFQLLNAYEAEGCFPGDFVFIVRLSRNDVNDNQMLELLDILNINNAIVSSFSNDKKSMADFLSFSRIYWKLLKSRNVTLFLGNFESKFIKLLLRFLPKKRCILLDDGAKSLSIQQKFTDDNCLDFFSLYTLSEISGQQLYKNTYKRLNSRLNNTEFEFDHKSVLFLGSKLSEIQLISESKYIELVKNIVCRQVGCKVLYLAHRGEDKSKLERINKELNIEVIDSVRPVELMGLYQQTMPYKVCSFYSTALYTLKAIYNIEAEGYTFDYTTSEHATIIDAVYKYHSTCMPIYSAD